MAVEQPFALAKIVLVRFALFRLAQLRFELFMFAPVRVAPLICALCRYVPVRSAPWQFGAQASWAYVCATLRCLSV